MVKVSVIMSVYNEPIEWIKQSIDSILNQTFKDFEFLIINDNPSRKENQELLSHYFRLDKRVIPIANQVNMGLTKSLNIGLRQAKGEYIARMDADDISLPERLDIQVSFLERTPLIDLCHVNFSRVDEQCKIIKKSEIGKFEQSDLFIRDVIAHPAVMFRRALGQLREPLYNENYKNAQDYELWKTLILSGKKIGFVNYNGLLYRVSKSQISAKQQGTQEENGRRIRRSLIAGYLNSQNINISEQDTSYDVYLKIKHADINNQEFANIKFIIYYSLAETSFKYSVRYLLDRNLLVFRLPVKLSLYVLLAKIKKGRWNLLRY